MVCRFFTLLAVIAGVTGVCRPLGLPSGTDHCEDRIEQLEHGFTIPGEAAVLNCSLVSLKVLDFQNTPYNLTWYDLRTGLEVREEMGHTMIRGTRLWFLNSTLTDQGSYQCVVRTPERCYKQTSVLHVELTREGECGRTQTTDQTLQALVNEMLVCPLWSYTKHVDSFSIRWYKGCELLEENDKYAFVRGALLLRDVSPEDAGFYTCRMTFQLGEITSEMAETIECKINEKYVLRPQVIEPSNEDIKANLGAPFGKLCRVFVPGQDISSADVMWQENYEGEEMFVSFDTSDRLHQKPVNQNRTKDGIWLERLLWFSEVLQYDFNRNFTCVVSSHLGCPTGQFVLLPAEPNLLLPIGLLLGLMACLFTLGVTLYSMFKVELTLGFRSVFPFFYASTDSDGKLYDAYVAYPRVFGGDSSGKAELFALKTLPEVLEGHYGYKLFILGRDSLPGEAVVDAVEDSMARCRRLLLLYTSSSLCSPEAVEWMEQRAGLHRVLLEGSLKAVLLELEEVSNPECLPLSVRLLREKQGAVQAWRKRRWTWCTKSEGTEGLRVEEMTTKTEEPLASISPSARFWRELRYHMPVRGKAKPSSHRSISLLNF
ncbi:interleukin-1 receptor type 1 [Chanos chanos]|uniref:Interleukin-1 receptor type 1-like n=1 Tax=Chanos chanos TaxID=29144 RepID=A0A6J2WGQ7_CHACN|nr:interleukin-1 receptor type 1-like [Chanos chanos]XP_030643514.1 interleukin-1 receptor type 1-like [Chanos chanos]